MLTTSRQNSFKSEPVMYMYEFQSKNNSISEQNKRFD